MQKKNAKLHIARLICALMALVLLASLWVLPISADETTGDDPYADPVEPEIDWSTVTTSGACGASMSWSYENGTLTLVGEGEMTNFREPDMAPWYPLRSEITRVVIPNGVNSIGSLAFYECKRLKTVIFPDSMRTVGSYAFAACEGLEVLHLGAGLQTIGAAAFYGCLSLGQLTLPYGLQTLGYQAFYRCESLSTVSIPEHLTQMGSSVFAYCTNLLRAEVNARLGALPEWTFYGCERLTVVVLPATVSTVENYAFKNCDELSTVYYSGDTGKTAEIRESIETDLPSFGSSGYISNGSPSDVTISGKYTENADGSVTQENTSVQQKETVTVVSKVEVTRPNGNLASPGTYKADVTVTVENKDGWSDAQKTVQETLKEINDTYSKNTTAESVDVKVYVKDDSAPNTAFVNEMAGRDVTMSVVTQNGSEWRVDCTEVTPSTKIETDTQKVSYDFSYTVGTAPASWCEQLGTSACYSLSFKNIVQMKAEVLVQLPSVPAHTNAFLYRVEKDGTLTRLQAVVVDQNGKAHFYLSTVSSDTQYAVGLNVPDEKTDDVIIPDELMTQYGSAVDRLQKIDYVATAHESSWGMDAKQVTKIMIAVIVGCVVLIGVVMYVINKLRVINGYTPKYETEE